jgi:glycosyltransferase involved in cell wall biosynthesis
MPIEKSTARTQLKLDPCAEILIGVGRLVEQKQPLEFLQIFAELSAKRPNLVAIWVGDGVLRSQLEERIAELGLAERFTITGWSDDVRRYLRAADVVVSTASYESFGYVVAESIAMGTPVVATRVGGVSDVLAECLTECTYSLSDEKSAHQLIESFLDDADFRAVTAEKGRLAVESKYSLKVMRDNANAFYACVLGVRASPTF